MKNSNTLLHQYFIYVYDLFSIKLTKTVINLM